MALGDVAPCRLQEAQALPRLGQDVPQGEGISPRCGQFQGQRQAVYLTTDVQQDGQVLRSNGKVGLGATCAIYQQLKGRIGGHAGIQVGRLWRGRPEIVVRVGEAADGENALPPQLQSFPGGGHDLDTGRDSQNLGQEPDPGQQSLQVVQDKEKLLAAQELEQLFLAPFQAQLQGVCQSRHQALD